MIDDNARRLIGGKDAEATETLHAAWRDCLINKQLEQMLSGTTIDLTGQSIAGNPTNASESNRPYNSPPLSAPSDGNGRRPNRPALSDESHLRGAGSRGYTLYQLPSDAWTLLEYYFAFTHSWLPMTDKASILKTMYSYPMEGLPRDAVNGADHAELWAIMALVSAQRIDKQSSDRVRNLAESLLPSGDPSFELPHIRAAIVLAMVEMLDGHMLAAWLRIGSVVRVLYLFKLLHQNLGQTTRYCRHIHLAAFVLESALALHLRTQGHLTSDYVASVGLVDEDGMEEWAPWQDPVDVSRETKAPTRSFSTLNELVRIYSRLVKEAPAQQPDSLGNAGSTKSIAITLMENAASKSNRVQPSVLVASQDTAVLDWSFSHGDMLDPFTAPPGTIGPPPASQVANLPNSQHHPFMSIPSEPAVYTMGSSPGGATISSAQWNIDGPLNMTSPEAGLDGASADIFEELASLERQDSTQHPAFLKNLGFAADIDLAEFFGVDYQPSDPLLAYLQPSTYSLPQNTSDPGRTT
jgi:hypothetical protein